MKKREIRSCGDCPFVELNYALPRDYEGVCSITPITITDLDIIHPDCKQDMAK
jgi:hypothetical protein